MASELRQPTRRDLALRFGRSVEVDRFGTCADFGMCTNKNGIHWMVNYTPAD